MRTAASLWRGASLATIIFITSITAVEARAAQASATPADQVRMTLLRLPYYGVFDLLSFQMDGGTVTLGGYAYRASLKDDAEKAVKKVPGVTQVVNQIEVLPVSISDDDVRAAAFRAIYSDTFLSHYASGAGPVFAGRRIWGSGFGAWPGFRTGRWNASPFLGMEPLGNYGIHIIVDRGAISLYGVVSNQTEKTKAGLEARGVFGSRSVDNQIQVTSNS